MSTTKYMKSAKNIIKPVYHSLIQSRCVGEEKLYRKCEFMRTYLQTEMMSYIQDNIRSDDKYQHLTRGYDFSPRCVYEIENAKMIGRQGQIINSNGEFILPSIKKNDVKQLSWYLKTEYSNILRYNISKIFNNKGIGKMPEYPVAMSMVTSINRGKYGHWLLEYIPMLYTMSRYERETGIAPKIIIDRDAPKWMIDSLCLLGYSKERLIKWNGEFTNISRLVFPITSEINSDVDSLSFSPVEHRWVHQKFRESVESEGNHQPKRIYVSRQGIQRRSISNFAEIEPILNDYDVEIIRPEELTFKQQVRTFSEAELIIGPLGSGLHNSLFAKNTNTVEITPPLLTYPMQYLLDTALGHDYTRITGIKYDSFPETPQNIKHDSFEVDVEEVKSTIDKLSAS